MIAHQILITTDKTLPVNIHPLIEKSITTFRNALPSAEHRLYSGYELEEFIQKNFDMSVYLAYAKLIPFAFKSDLARLCLLHFYGGLYSDLLLQYLSPVDLTFLEKFDFCAFRDRQYMPVCDTSFSTFNIANTILFSKPKSLILEKYIENIVMNCKKELYGVGPLDITGPLVLGKSLHEAVSLGFDQKKIHLIGDFTDLTYEKAKENMAFVGNDGNIFALRRRPLNFFKSTNIGNEYNDLYKQRKIYDKSIVIP